MVGIILLNVLDLRANSQTKCAFLLVDCRRKLQEADGQVFSPANDWFRPRPTPERHEPAGVARLPRRRSPDLGIPPAATRLPRRVELGRKKGGYARTLLFGDDQLSLWAMVWDVGAKTSIHDHHCSCCFGVLTGALTEIEFGAIDKATAVMTSQAMRMAGHIACMVPTGPNLHQIVNDRPCEAISLHIYGYDHTTRATSVDREYRLATH